MKNAFKTISMTLLMVLTITTMAFADNQAAVKLQEKLRALGIADTYIGAAVEYLQKIEITDEQLETIDAKIEEAKGLIGNEKDLSKLDDSTKLAIQGVVQEAASTLGLKVSFGKNEMGVTTATITDLNNKPIMGVNTLDLFETVTNISFAEIIDVIQIAVEFSNSAENDKFKPISGTLNKTATNYGNIMAIGLGLVVLSGTLFIGSKKRLA